MTLTIQTVNADAQMSTYQRDILGRAFPPELLFDLSKAVQTRFTSAIVAPNRAIKFTWSPAPWWTFLVKQRRPGTHYP